MNSQQRKNIIWPFLATIAAILSIPEITMAQNETNYIRVARIVVDSAQLESYKTALKEGVEAAVREEPGVLSLYAVYDIKKPTHVTVFEIYRDVKAYNTHIQTAHFIKYKTTVANMVQSLELTDVMPIALEDKSKHK